jgi:hypothetical protein
MKGYLEVIFIGSGYLGRTWISAATPQPGDILKKSKSAFVGYKRNKYPLHTKLLIKHYT